MKDWNKRIRSSEIPPPVYAKADPTRQIDRDSTEAVTYQYSLIAGEDIVSTKKRVQIK